MEYEVNIDVANKAKQEMLSSIGRGVGKLIARPGAFAAAYDFCAERYADPVIVLKTEEPGSKQLLAMQHDRFEGVCFDMINHLVNDCIVMGAKPLTVQDAIICGKMDGTIVNRIVAAISDACVANECMLTGGETSEQPHVIDDGVYILTSSIVGIVERAKLVDGTSIREGDCVIALESNGAHTNGYTLIRAIMQNSPELLDESVDGEPFIDAVLRPHRAYYKCLRSSFESGLINGAAHITGGGICENLNRILPENLNAEIDLDTYEVPELFKKLRSYGNVSDKEMVRTFNLGVGMALVVDPENVNQVMRNVESHGVKSWIIGRIVPGEQKVTLKGNLKW